MSTLQHQIAFAQAKGMLGTAALEMLRRIGGVDNFFTLTRSQLASLSGTNPDIFDDNYRRELLAEAEHEAAFVTANNITAAAIDSECFPRRISDCSDAPAILYKIGNCNLDARHVVGIVGTRHATPYGIDFTTKLVTQLAEKLDDLLIVSGLAYGIDVAAHKAALDCDVPTVAIMAHGLNMVYPADHRSIAARMVEKGGALITEYTTSARIHRSNFLARNRIVAALCDALVVVESDVKGGSMSTAHIANAYNRDVFALPGRINDIYSRGTNKLIYSNQAVLLRSADDMIEHMGWQPRTPKIEDTPQLFPTLDPEQQRFYDFILSHPEATVNDACVHLGMSYAAVSNIVFQLEMKDVIMALPGGRFSPTT